MEYKLYRGDCMDFLGNMRNTADLIIADPPYGIDYQSQRKKNKDEWLPKIANDDEPFIDWIPLAFDVLKDNKPLICFCRWDVQDIFKGALVLAGFTVKSQVIWDKVLHGTGDLEGEFAPQHEIMWFASKGRFTFPGKRPKTVISEMRLPPNYLTHPNEKPVKLMMRLIDYLTRIGDTVVDPFVGSGSSGEAAVTLDRNYIGVDIDETYYLLAENRIENAIRRLQGKSKLVPTGTMIGTLFDGIE